jgi:WD40 repeat protein
MSSIFISHSSRDAHVAGELRDRLAERGYHSVFLDFDPQVGIPAGRDWEKELYARLRACHALIVLCSEHSMASRWCFAEITHAKALGKHIFPIRIDGTPVDGLLTERQVIDATAGWEEAYPRLWGGLLSAGLDPNAPMSWDPARPPYPGLLAFQEEDAAVFFGRDTEIRRGLDLLNQLHRFGGPRLVLVLGASGSGKSSLARAGLLPRLRRDASAWLPLDPFRPLDRPFAELARAVAAGFARAGKPREWDAIHDRLLRDGAPAEEIRDRFTALLEELREASDRREGTVLLSIDQCEELLAHATAGEVERFLPFLASLLRSPGNRLLVLGTLRSDFLGTWQQQPSLQGIPFESLPVGPMAQEALAQVIAGPAQVAGIELAEGLVPAMAGDTGTADALPLLAFTLRELWEGYGEDGRLEVSEYRDALGGLEGSVARAAEAVLRAHVVDTGRGTLEAGVVQLSGEDEAGLREAFLSMVRVGDEGRFARRPLAWGELPGHVRDLLQRFVAARLLVPRPDGGEVEVAHEALFRAWDRLVRWLDANREFLVWRRRLDEALAEWERRERHPAALLAGPALAEAMAWLERHEGGEVRLSEAELELVRASDAVAREAEAAREEQRRRELEQAKALADEQARRVDAEHQRAEDQTRAARRLKSRLVLASALALLAVMALMIAGWAYTRATTERNRAISLGLAQRSSTDLETDRALLLAVAAVMLDDNLEVRGNLLNRLQRDPRLCCMLHSGDVPLALTPDGKRFATLDSGRVLLWDAATGDSLGYPLGGREKEWIYSVAFSPDGKSLAVVDSAGRVRLWSLAGGAPAPPRELVPPGRGTGTLAFSPDGRFVAVASRDDSWVRLWSVSQTGGVPLAPVDSMRMLDSYSDGHVPPSVAFSPDGRLLATGSERRPVRVWEVEGGRMRLRREKDHAGMTDLSFVDGGNLAIGHRGGISLVDAATGASRTGLLTAVSVGSMVSSADGTWLAAAGYDGKVRLWNLATAPPLVGVDLAALSPDRRLMATAGGSAARIWDIEKPLPRGLPAWNPRAALPCPAPCSQTAILAFSADGALLAEGSRVGVQLRRVADATPVGSLLSPPPDVRGIFALALGERTLAAAWIDGRIRLWSVSPVASLDTLKEDTIRSAPNVLVFGPDDSVLSVGKQDGTVQLWSTATRTLQRELRRGEAGAGAPAPSSITAMRFSRDGRRLTAADAEGNLLVWDVDRSDPVASAHHEGPIYQLAISPDGEMLALGTTGGIQLWDGTVHRPIGGVLSVGDSADVADLSFSEDGRVLVSVSTRGVPIYAGGDGMEASVRNWDVSLAAWIARACRIAGRPLKPEEWADYVGPDIRPKQVCETPRVRNR